MPFSLQAPRPIRLPKRRRICVVTPIGQGAPSATSNPGSSKDVPKAASTSSAGGNSRQTTATVPAIEQRLPSISQDTAGRAIVRQLDNLVTGRLVKRYKRFLADVQINGIGEQQQPATVTVHCPNTGPMVGLLESPFAPLCLSHSADAKRKYCYTLEWIQEPGGAWVGVHSARANAVVATLLAARLVEQMQPYTAVQTEVKYGTGGKSRVDFVLTRPSGGKCFVEVKSVTLAQQRAEDNSKVAMFPDTVSKRAQRHMEELIACKAAGHEAAMIFLVQRGDCASFAPCHEKDPVFCHLVLQGAAAGVQLLALSCCLELQAGSTGLIKYLGPLTVDLLLGQAVP